ncbi:MAG: hypothetical protein JSR58_06165 [Verrucomicrobia bacterium]|nr:hypothetical protein [Verrucomicrobiota bacterium]
MAQPVSAFSRLPFLPSLTWTPTDILSTAYQYLEPYVPRVLQLLENRLTLALGSGALCITALALVYLRKGHFENSSTPSSLAHDIKAPPITVSEHKTPDFEEGDNPLDNYEKQPPTSLWKEYILSFTQLPQTPIIDETTELSLCRQAIEKKPTDVSVFLEVAKDKDFVQLLDLKALIRYEKAFSTFKRPFFKYFTKILQKIIIIKLQECPKETLQRLQQESCSTFVSNHLHWQELALHRKSLKFAKRIDPEVGEIAVAIENLPDDQLPTINQYVKAAQLRRLQANIFSLKDLIEMHQKMEKSTHPDSQKILLRIQELFWNNLSTLKSEELPLEKDIPSSDLKQILLQYTQACELAQNKTPSPNHGFPYALALALLPENAQNEATRNKLICEIHKKNPKRNKKANPLQEQIHFLESIPHKTPFMQKRLKAYQYLLDPPPLPAPAAIKPTPLEPPPPPKKAEKNLKDFSLACFLELLKETPDITELQGQIDKITKTTNPREVALHCLPQLQHLSLEELEKLLLSVFQKLSSPTAQEKLSGCVVELIWEKLATLKSHEIAAYVNNQSRLQNKEHPDILRPIKQTYDARRLTPMNTKDALIQSETDPFTLALAIEMQKPQGRTILYTTLDNLLKKTHGEQRKTLLANYETLLKGLPSSSNLAPLTTHRRNAYKKLCTKLKELLQ